MAEYLTLASPDVTPVVTSWRVVNIWLDMEVPSIKVTLKANTGLTYVWRFVPDPDGKVTAIEVRDLLKVINRGVRGKSLERWLLEQIHKHGVKIGTIEGTPD